MKAKITILGLSYWLFDEPAHPIYRYESAVNEFYKKGCQEKSFPLDRTARRFLSRDPAHCL